MSNRQENPEKLNIILKGESADKFRRIKGYLGLENDTEVIRILLTWYYNQYEKDLSGPPKTMWHLNLNDQGVIIWDPFISKGVQINFTPKGLCCTYDERNDCKHVQFALSRPDIQNVIRQKRKEGWKLPDI